MISVHPITCFAFMRSEIQGIFPTMSLQNNLIQSEKKNPLADRVENMLEQVLFPLQ